MNWQKLAGIMCVLGVTCAQAAEIVVNRLQMPAWVVHANGVRQALAPNMSLKVGDTLQTGQGARVELALSEGSIIKLGALATFRVTSLIAPEDNKGVFASALDVIKGAFRFTTGSSQKSVPRAIDIKISSVTAGIRGTDLWGKSDEQKDLVCLLEGKISVAHADQHLDMDKPLQYFVAKRDGTAMPGFETEDEVMNKWAPQTEVSAGHGLASIGGKWRAILAAYKQRPMADSLVRKLDEAGFAASLVQRHQPGGRVFEVALNGLAEEADARYAGQQAREVVPGLTLKVSPK